MDAFGVLRKEDRIQKPLWLTNTEIVGKIEIMNHDGGIQSVSRQLKIEKAEWYRMRGGRDDEQRKERQNKQHAQRTSPPGKLIPYTFGAD